MAPPAFDDDLRFGKAVEDLTVEQLVPELRVEALAVAVLPGAALLDECGLCTDGGDALALFIRFWLTTTPPVPDDQREAANAKGKERYASFVETLGRRLAKGKTLAKEVLSEREPSASHSD